MLETFLPSGEASSSETVTRLLVTGQVNLEDIWTLFSIFGEVSSIVLVEGGTKVTFQQDDALEKFHQSGEITFGAERLLVTKIKETKDQESLSMRFSQPPPPVVHTGRRFTVPPPPLAFRNIPPPPLPSLPSLPPSSTNEVSIIRSPQSTPPPQPQPEIFTFKAQSFLETKIGQSFYQV